MGVLRGWNVDPASYRHATNIQYTFDPLANEYLRRSVGVDGANRIYREAVPSAFWTVRFFRDLQKEEYLVVLLPDGGLHSVHHTIAESAPGANLSKEDALARAAAFLRDTKKLDLSQWKLIESQSDKLPARTDHTFVWEQIAPVAPVVDSGAQNGGTEGAHMRVSLAVQGDEVSGYRISIHVPEDWRLRQTQTTLAVTLRTIGLSIFAAAFGIAVLVAFFRNLRTPFMAAAPWKRLARWSLVVLVASLATYATSEQQYLATYRTDLPFRTFVGTMFIGLSLGAALFYSGTICLFGVACVFLARRYGTQSLPVWRALPAAYYRDALTAGVCGATILMALRRLPVLAGRMWPVARYDLGASVPDGLDAHWPALHAIAAGVTHSLIGVGVLALALGFAASYLRPSWLQAALLVLLAVLAAPRAGSPGDFAQSAVIGLLELGIVWWGAQRILRFNLLGYVLVALLVSLSAAASELLPQPNALFRANAWVVIAAGIALLLWTAARWGWGSRPGARGNVGGEPII